MRQNFPPNPQQVNLVLFPLSKCLGHCLVPSHPRQSLSRTSRLSRSACRARVFPNPHLALGKSVDEAALDRLFRVPSSYLICIKPGAESALDKTLRCGTVEKLFFGDQHPPPPPPYLRVWMTGPPLI